VRSHHRFLIGQHLKTIEHLEETIAAFDARIEAALEPFRDALERLKEDYYRLPISREPQAHAQGAITTIAAQLDRPCRR
jgi:hypothetical protein